MFSRKQTSSADPTGPIRASKHGTNLRGDALVLASLLMILLTYAAPACRANTNNNADGTANTDANVATNARPITPPAGTEVAGDSSSADSGGTPAFISSDSLTAFNNPASIHLRN